MEPSTPPPPAVEVKQTSKGLESLGIRIKVKFFFSNLETRRVPDDIRTIFVVGILFRRGKVQNELK